MIRWIRNSIVMLIAFSALFASADSLSISFSKPDTLKAIIDLPLLEIPFSWEHHYYLPSMGQALGAGSSLYEGLFFGIDFLADRLIPPKYLFFNYLAQDAVSFGLIYLSGFLPLGTAWVHEEFHRAVLWQNQIDSYNSIYDFRFSRKVIAVNDVEDSSLARLKLENNTELVRAEEAGYEAQQELALKLEKDMFFHNLPYSQSSGIVYNWYTTMVNILYLNKCASVKGDLLISEMNKSDGAKISTRDFIGLDFTAWTYDLFRPDTFYAARGTHPSGVGINRYVKYADLSNTEQAYLENESNISWLSLLNPMLFGINRIPLGTLVDGRPVSMNFNIRHLLTPFGHTINANVFFMLPPFNLFVSLLNQENRNRYFPGLDVQLVDFPLSLLGQKNVLASARLMAWAQPESLDFTTKKPKAGGLGSLRLVYQLLPWFRISAEFEGKSGGWAPGNVYLDQNVSGKLGVAFYIR